MMPIIAFTNQKGGCAKSTSSVHLCHWFHKQGYSVTLIDADAQRSSSIWLKSMDIEEIGIEILQSPDDLLEQIPDISKSSDYTVVDGPAGLSEATRAILFRTDLAIVPCQPTGVDLRSAADAVKLIRQAQSVRNGPPDAAVFLARAVKGTRLKDEAISLLGKSNIPVLKTTVHQKQVVADCFGQQATVWDMPGRAATESAREFEQLFKEITELLP